jgi:hypothetical protein
MRDNAVCPQHTTSTNQSTCALPPACHTQSNLHALASSAPPGAVSHLTSERSVDITFTDLVTDGFFPAGTYAFSVGHVERAVARVSPAGDITWRGKTYASISGFALDVVRTIYPGRQACNGWKESWLGELQLEAWRLAYRLKQTAPAVPPGCIITGAEAAEALREPPPADSKK